ncbi:MAG: hypothetical protein HOV67_32945 [Kribbellaceae bacterium]|nr:hypothetical protein [Kribbellaceae bacterium]
MTDPSEQARLALATLPLSFPEPEDVVFVSGEPGWPAGLATALKSGAVVLVDPVPAEVDELPAVAGSVVVDTPWASNPAIENAADAFREAATEGSRVECRVIAPPGSDFTKVLLHQVILIRAVLDPVTRLRILHLSEHSLHAEGTTETSVAIDFSIVCTRALPASASLRLITSDGSVDLSIPSSDTAQPARLTTVGPSGAVQAPTQYETAHRATLRRLRELQATGPADGLTELRHLQADIDVTTDGFHAAPYVLDTIKELS